ncbi:TIGR01244 family sulfur transferase [Noviherbaspirillum autotrophicum]|uniref:Beta-lactamase hydrolase-like protein phosphatase-like domain-containing protein n=1 Tax=Noviherbaspirillum autotrophicum TaxID=709839 RepID=A0A0C1XYX1_9BURK|nr:TIGR01244 family sulfur transferase [Noviherbaspirillum autotrophicum]KIF79963.1 hypothetical protein TSA66_02590 [Noviherbaspirillum autotrophicum]
MTATVTPIDDKFCVAPQLRPEELADIARMGFRSVINNRPDGEGGAEQPQNALLESAASAAGIAYAYLPVNPRAIDQEAVDRMRKLVETLPTPILAFCRSGARSTALYRLAMEQAKGGQADV